jgi:putative transposase
MVGRAAHRETGDRGPVASSWLSPLLALAIPTAGGRPRISEEIRTLIRRPAVENAAWAPRIHGGLLKLGFDVSERSVARYLRRVPRRGDPASRWSAFLANHREAIVAYFFTVATLTFQRLSCFFVIEHRRRTIRHVNVTREPTPAWVVQPLRDVFPGDGPYRFMLLDHDSTFDLTAMSAGS